MLRLKETSQLWDEVFVGWGLWGQQQRSSDSDSRGKGSGGMPRKAAAKG